MMDDILKSDYGLPTYHTRKMEGYGSLNYKIAAKECNYVLKINAANPKEISWLEAENQVLQLLSSEGDGFPKPIANQQREFITYSEKDNVRYANRLLTFVNGNFFSDIPHTKQLFTSLGRFLGKMDCRLNQFFHDAIGARQIEWDLQYFLLNEKYIDYITDPHDASIVKYFFLQYKEEIVPKLAQLRKSTIHNDANDQNLLTHNDEVSGIIDFGDMAYAPLICELAIALAYALMGKDDLLEWTIPVIEGYHKEMPITTDEIEVLYYLIAARLCTSVCNSAFHKINNPNSDYITLSEQGAWQLLKKWLTLNPLQYQRGIKKSLGIDDNEAPKIGKLLKKRGQFISKSLSTSYTTPVWMEKAAFQYMYDGYGNTYLDAYNNIPHVGHQHPEVVAAGMKQMAKLNTNTRYLYNLLGDYAEKLIGYFPKPLEKVFFVNSGSAASDLAIRLALNYTSRHQIMVMEHGYHGNTRLGIDISHYKYGRKGGHGKVNHILEAKLPNVYREQNNDPANDLGPAMAKETLNNHRNHSIAAFIAEPIVGCGGQVPLAPGYLREIYAGIRDLGGVCISDEVQTGFGRVGETFWGFELQQVIPDIVVLGKPMGNGHPIGAVVTTKEIADAFDNGMEFFSSFGGNPVSCAIGISVLEVIENEGLQKNALEQGEYFKIALQQLSNKYECIGDIRGSGLFLGIEFVKSRSEKIPDTETAQYLKNALKEDFILVSTDGPYNNVIKMKPPLCFNRENIDQVVYTIDKHLSARP